jgi:hypothetical protein
METSANKADAIRDDTETNTEQLRQGCLFMMIRLTWVIDCHHDDGENYENMGKRVNLCGRSLKEAAYFFFPSLT